MRIPSFLTQNRVLVKASVVVRLLLAAVVAGALVAGLSLPAVGALGTIVRNGATHFNTLSTPELHQLPVRSAILDRHGKVLAYYYPRGIDRVPVTYSQIAPVMRQAIVAIEDDRFYQHGAIDFRGTVRALVNNLQHKSVQGGSTLAQQYVKNVEILSSPDPEKVYASATAQNVGRKIRELRMAVQAEHMMSRDQILAGYLNAAFFGNQSYGIQVAAQRYFSTSAAKLTLPQAAMLAGIVENPSLYNPLGNTTEVQQTLTRRNTVLARMAQLHYVPSAAVAAAEKTKLALNPSPSQTGCTSNSAKYAGYLCDYVVAVIKHDTAYRQVWNRLNGIGGLTITTTLDPKDQKAANRAVNYEMPPPPNRANPAKNADSEVLIQPGTGKIRAIANDRPYGTGKRHEPRELCGRPAVRRHRRRADRLHRQGLRHGDRAAAGHTVRVLEDGGLLRRCLRLHQLQGPAGRHPAAERPARVGGPQRRERAWRALLALHRHHRLDQRVLRLPGAEGRPLQRRSRPPPGWA